MTEPPLDLDAMRNRYRAGSAIDLMFIPLVDELERTRRERVVLTSVETAAALAGMQARAECAEAERDAAHSVIADQTRDFGVRMDMKEARAECAEAELGAAVERIAELASLVPAPCFADPADCACDPCQRIAEAEARAERAEGERDDAELACANWRGIADEGYARAGRAEADYAKLMADYDRLLTDARNDAAAIARVRALIDVGRDGQDAIRAALRGDR